MNSAAARTPEQLLAELQRLERVQARHWEFFDQLGTLDQILGSGWGTLTRETILGLLHRHLAELIPIGTAAFFFPDPETLDFEVAYCEPAGETAAVEAEVRGLIREGVFAWALRQNRPVLTQPEGSPLQFLLHSLGTPARRLGVFVARMARGSLSELDFRLRMVSMILQRGAFSLESTALYRELQEHNQRLEARVEERTAELARKNEDLMRLDQEKNEFLGIVTHDLKNPLIAIKGLAGFLVEDEQPPEDVRSLASSIVKTADEMFTLVVNLLNVAALEQGRVPVNPRLIHLGDTLRRGIAAFEDRAAQKHLTLLQELPPSCDGVWADQTITAQVFENLLSNAIKYSPQGRRIWVSTRLLEDGRVRVAVRDEGPGLSDKDKARLFGRFQRLSARPTGGEHSSGLGLFIVKRLTESMHGSVGCESEFGKGSTFYIDLPRSEPPAAS